MKIIFHISQPKYMLWLVEQPKHIFKLIDKIINAFYSPKGSLSGPMVFGWRYCIIHYTGFQVGPIFPTFPYFFDLLLLFPTFS